MLSKLGGECAISLYMICPLGVENRNLGDISGKAAAIGAFQPINLSIMSLRLRILKPEGHFEHKNSCLRK